MQGVAYRAGRALMRCIAAALSFPPRILPASASVFAFRTALAVAVAMGGSVLCPVLWGAGDAAAQQGQTVPPEWALIPSGMGRGDSFRLLFVTYDGAQRHLVEHW